MVERDRKALKAIAKYGLIVVALWELGEYRTTIEDLGIQAGQKVSVVASEVGGKMTQIGKQIDLSGDLQRAREAIEQIGNIRISINKPTFEATAVASPVTVETKNDLNLRPIDPKYVAENVNPKVKVVIQLNDEAADALESMFDDAGKENFRAAVRSGYMSEKALKEAGYRMGRQSGNEVFISDPGFEHFKQGDPLGFAEANKRQNEGIYKWLRLHAGKYGFYMKNNDVTDWEYKKTGEKK